ncbi:MAG TPA: protein-L-isoaspartate(D-aspartate) O-methyltransferase [Candidatus Paceibacterota bacterium]|nr:protein-L-isoaspartate(D-aspartate) O-methyltransferase [Verrucomicrobiota bacterium]HSA12328.1 protein-L-isoaspartate(D-aspartate) O-methyltransferase [Candidatus Paceibacterota bacterium]
MRKLALVMAGWLTGFAGRGTAAPAIDAAGSDPYAPARQRMVAEQLVGPGRNITNTWVLTVMGRIPRHEFVPERRRSEAYRDHPLPIGHGQTISQPFIVAFMSERLEPKPADRVLEIGTGSGYQAAVLAELVAQVYTIEIVEDLARRAATDLKRLGYTNVHVRAGDGYQGWPEAAPFDAIIVTCAPEQVPKRLIEQLKDGGRMIIPVGRAWNQELVLLRKQDGKLEQQAVLPVRFVPMTGAAEERSKVKSPSPRQTQEPKPQESLRP